MQQEYLVENASLDAHYDVAYFRDFNIPDGSVVYEVVGNKVRKGYRQGGPSSPNAPIGWMLLFNVVIVLVLITLIAARQVRKRRVAS